MSNRGLTSLIVATGVCAASATAAERLGGRDHESEVDSLARTAPATPPLRLEKEDVPHTVTWWCVDLNELWNVNVPVIVGAGFLTRPEPSPLPPCPDTSSFPITIPAGSRWTVGNDVWWTNKTYPPAVAEALKTIGYKFVSDSPMEDLMKKIVEVRYVVITFPGGEFVTEFRYDPQKSFRLVRFREFNGPVLEPFVDPVLGIDISADAVGRLPAISFPRAIGGGLSPGSYRAQVFWVLSDLHNDGLGLADGSFLPAGEILFVQPRFEVVP